MDRLNTRKATLVAPPPVTPGCTDLFFSLPFHLVNLRSSTQEFFLIIHSVSVHITPSLIVL